MCMSRMGLYHFPQVGGLFTNEIIQGRESVTMDLILASTSPRRIELMDAMGLDFLTMDPHINEGDISGPDPEVTCMARAEAKALSVAARRPDATVIAADTVVVLDGKILDKARSDEEVRSMLQSLSGKEHQVITAIALCMAGFKDANVITDKAQVTFRELEEEEVEWYVGTGEGVGKAGGYAAQGNGGMLIAQLDGDRETVIGLSTSIIRRMLES
jgi:septum formation protein